jgi:signal transduction histidine kinase/CheY-like chemotaxis protein
MGRERDETQLVAPFPDRSWEDKTVNQEALAGLVVLAGEQAGRRIRLSEEEFLLGRAMECGFRVSSTRVSRQHARLRKRSPFEWEISDLGSSNGTYVGNSRVQTQRLRFGDRISLGGGVLLLFTPIDELEEALMHHQRMESIGSLAGGIAHDFNNLLGVSLGNLEFLEQLSSESNLRDPIVREALADMKEAALKAAHLTKALLDFARRGKHEEVPVNLTDLVLKSVNVISRTLGTSIVFDVEAEPELVVIGDAAQLNQILLNLCVNARDAMPNGGRIEVRASRADPGPLDSEAPLVKLTVRDTGTGMSEDVKERIFEPFFTTKSTKGGTGLGLSTVYGSVVGHGGSISVRSAPSKGTTFSILLPRAIEIAPTRPTTTPFREPKVEGHGAKLLIVDDEKLHLRSTARLLEHSGFRVFAASSGPEAARIARESGPMDLALVDLIMPGMGGVETMDRILALCPETRVVLTTGYVEPAELKDVQERPKVPILRKPYTRTRLLRAVSDALLNPAAPTQSLPTQR